jgi:hypothetical protein
LGVHQVAARLRPIHQRINLEAVTPLPALTGQLGRHAPRLNIVLPRGAIPMRARGKGGAVFFKRLLGRQ